MESARWLVLSPMVVAIAASALAPGRLGGAPAGETAWDPPPCQASDAAPPGDEAWYRLDPVLDRTGTLAGRRLVVGVVGGTTRSLELAPESFASGPVHGLVVAGEDDGSASHLRLLDPLLGCATVVADEADVIRSAILAGDGRSLYEHRVDRATRADLGVWRRGLDGSAVRVLDGLPPDARLGPTFITDLVLAADGRLAVSSCAPAGCRVRVLDPTTGDRADVRGTGPALGLADASLVVRAACGGYPCPVERVDLGTGARRTLAVDAFAAAMAGGRLVVETAGGRVAVVEVATGHRTGAEVASGLLPIRAGSTASAGAEAPPGSIVLAPGGRPDGRTLRHLDTGTGTVRVPGEVAR